MPGHSTVLGFCGPLTDHDLGADEILATPLGARPGHAQGPSGAQARHQLAAKSPAALNIERLVDGLMGDPHRLIIGEIADKAVGDLLRAPRSGPRPILTAAVAAADPSDVGPRHRAAIGPRDHASKTVSDVLSQLFVRSQLGHFGATRTPFGMPLGRGGPVLQAVRPSRRVAPKLPRDRRGVAAQTPSDLAHPDLLGMQDGDVFAFNKRQIPPRDRGQADRWHPASVAEPSGPDRRRHTRRHSGVLA